MTVFQMVDVAVPVDALANSAPGQGPREGTRLEFVNAVNKLDD